MTTLFSRIAIVGSAMFFSACALHAAPKVEQDPMGPDDQVLGCSISPDGTHTAALIVKGTHIQILYDNAAGPKVDCLLHNTSTSGNVAVPAYYSGQIPVVFSDDSAHWAYMARSGDDCIVNEDGKELARTPIRSGAPVGEVPLTFSAGGKHLFYSDCSGADANSIVVDGKAGPPMHLIPTIAFSPDGDHYAYVGQYTNAGQGVWSFVDGKQVNYFGDNLQYTGRGVLMSQMNLDAKAGGGVGLFLNGKPTIKAARISPIWTSPDGKEVAMLIGSANSADTFLTVNGKMIDGTQGLIVEKVYFSPDGKRWAALCDSKTNTKFMIIDGKKGEAYQNIAQDSGYGENNTHWALVAGQGNPDPKAWSNLVLKAPGFTADSASFVFVATASGRQFLEVDDFESDGFNSAMPTAPVISPTGHRVAMIGTAANNKQHLIVDGKDVTNGTSGVGDQRLYQLSFSPKGTHVAYEKGYTIYLDNVAQPGVVQGNYVFSPEDSHIAYMGISGGHPTFIVDGKDICDEPGQLNRIFFSPDGQHVYWISTRAVKNSKDSNILYVDGKVATHFMPPINGVPITPSFSSDGVMTFIALIDGNLRRFHVTSETNLAALLATAPAAKAN